MFYETYMNFASISENKYFMVASGTNRTTVESDPLGSDLVL